MNRFAFLMRRPVTTLTLVVALISGGVFGLHKMRVDIPGLNTPMIYAQLDALGVRAKQAKGYIVGRYESYFHKHNEEEEAHQEQHKVVVTSPMAKDVIITHKYVCQIHSQRHIEVQALESGYLEPIPVKEGQKVKKGEVLFKIVPTLYQARLHAEKAEADLARLEFNNTNRLFKDKTHAVSENEVMLFKAKLDKAEAKVELAEAELNFTTVKARFDGIVDRLLEQEGSLVKEGDILTTLSDNSVMWVYFNVPESDYLKYRADLSKHKGIGQIELVLANGSKFNQIGQFDPDSQVGAIEANFNNQTGNIPFRADFRNPDRLLRHGQTGTVWISRVSKDAIIIPQRAVFENLAKQYVYVVDKDGVVRQRDVVIQYALDDIFAIQEGLDLHDKIILEGIRQVRDGEKVQYEFLAPEKALSHLKFHAE